jgi:hypothetical protein
MSVLVLCFEGRCSMWPFRKSQNEFPARSWVPIPQVTLAELSDEERHECQAFINSLFAARTDGDGQWFATDKDSADSTQRMFVAGCLMRRARKFLIRAGFVPQNSLTDCHMYGGDPHRRLYVECVANAISAAAKACAICPLPINFYDFGCLLRSVGKEEDAKTAFAEFLKRYRAFPVRPVETPFFDQRNMDVAVLEAENELSRSSVEEKIRTEVTAETMAEALASFTFEPAPGDVLEVLGTDIEGTVVDKAKVGHELLLLRICIIDHFLMRLFRGDDTLVVFWFYLTLCKHYVTVIGLNEEMVLDELEKRGPAYGKAWDQWSEGMRLEHSGIERPLESVFPLHDAFASFCGMKPLSMRVLRPLSVSKPFIVAFDDERSAVEHLLLKMLGESKIVCSAEEIKAAREVLQSGSS